MLIEFGKNVENNMKDRLRAFNLIVEGAEKDAVGFIENLRKLRPVTAVAELGKAKGEGALNFVEKQCEITRRWVKK